jgi:multiple sugar transport system permease protein
MVIANKRVRNRIKQIATGLSVIFYLLFALLPLSWVVLTSFRTLPQIYKQKDMLTPRDLTFQNYIDLFTKREMANWLINSALIAVSVTLICLVLSVFAAYSLTRLKYRGAETMAKAVLFLYLLPPALLYIPLYVMLSRLGILNSPWALFLTYPTFVLPFCTWLLMGYFKTIPEELEDAARIDGCSRLRVLYNIVLPLAIPSLVTAVTFSLAEIWREYLYAFVFINSNKLKLIQVGVASLRVGDTMLWGLIMAGAVISTIPPVLLYIFLQQYIVQGMTAGAVKG